MSHAAVNQYLRLERQLWIDLAVAEAREARAKAERQAERLGARDEEAMVQAIAEAAAALPVDLREQLAALLSGPVRLRAVGGTEAG
jgi:hypothetical protein